LKILVPCCGRSTRYATELPKWLLPAQDGRPMLALAIEGLESGGDIVVTILSEHEERFKVRRGLAEVLGPRVTVIELEAPTSSQSETVARTLQALSYEGPFLIKDSDNTFTLSPVEAEYNYVCVDSLNNHDLINPRNKSYLQVDHQGIVVNIREKEVISDLFSVGGYHFTSGKAFLEHYRRLAGSGAPWRRECYVSDVIGSMILEGAPFKARPVGGYRDWGTLADWQRALTSTRVFFVSLDGFVFDRGSRYFAPRFENAQPKPEAIAALTALVGEGHRIVYLSIRPRELAEATRRQLAAASAPEGEVVFDCAVAPWVLLTAPHSTLPFQGGQAIQLSPAETDLCVRLLGGS
jgi:hypothetical protein